MTHRFAALLGNGASLAYNPDLSVASLTKELIVEFGKLGASDAETALKKLAQESHRDPSGGFESMLGPLETTSRSLDALVDLGPILASTAAAGPLQKTQAFVREVHRVGLATVLSRIARHSTGVGGTSFGRIEDFGDAMKSLCDSGDLTVATLNYDGLTHAGLLLNSGSVADLADGREDKWIDVVPGKPSVVGHLLRSVDDFPDGRTPILQLHGSLAWLRDPDSGAVWRFSLDDLRAINYWSKLKVGQTGWTPVVVLTDQKERLIGRKPFALAYDIFQQRLIAADRWLVAGYGLGDAPVNELFRSAWKTRVRSGLSAPELLVIDYGLPDVSAHRKDVASAFGVPKGQVSVSTEGVPDATNSTEWANWAS